MHIRQELTVRLSQNLVMTQSLQQAIKLLQLSKMELETLIRQELEENPILDEEINETEPTETELNERTKDSETSEVKPDGKTSLEEIDHEYFYDDYIEYQNTRVVRETIELPAFDSTLASPTSLGDHLTWQLNFSIIDEIKQEIGIAIIGNLDSDGYLHATTEELIELTGASEKEIEEVRTVIQCFDPVGVATNNLQECLLVQLRLLEEDVQLPIKIVQDYLGYLEKHAYEELAKVLSCKLDDIQQALETIRSLDPKPGSKYSLAEITFVEPDVFIIKNEDEYVIILNEENLPKLKINTSYKHLISRGSKTKEETKTYIREKMNDAKWLLKSFVQRQKTIYKVVESIVDRQKLFLDNGVEHLKPMILSDVAFDINMHESTVSRVVTNKYVHTPRGVFELKYFFSTGIRSSYGEDVSSLAVKQKIKQIIEEESSHKPLSDNKIMATLNRQGLKIARRTVAKYREEMRIPPSKLRKSVF